MEFPKREPCLPQPQGSPRRSPKAMRPGAATEADENASAKRPVPAWTAPPQRKKVLRERNGVGGEEATASPPAPQPKPGQSPPTLTGRGAGPYDPKTNYTTPRPAFLRYDPERRREMLLRVARTAEVEYDYSSSTVSGTAASEDDGGSVASDAAVASPVSSARGSDSEAELDEEEEEVGPARRGQWARRLFLLLVAVACSFCYIHCMNLTAFPDYSNNDLDFVETIAGDHELESLRLLGPVYMMGPDDLMELEETASQTVQQHTEEGVHLYEQRVSPRNLVAVTMMGLADMCLNVPSGEFTCQLWGESIEEVAIDSFGEQSREVSYLSGNTSLDSIGSTCTHISDMEEDCSGLVHQEGGEDNSDRFVLKLVPIETAMKSASDKLNSRLGLESEDLSLWQYEYENTGEAAKAICSTVKFLLSAMEPHLFQILACLSVVGMVSALFSYYRRSRLNTAPASQHMTSKSLQAAQLPELTVPDLGLQQFSRLEVPVEGPLPKPDSFVICKDPVQESLPKTNPLVSPKVDTVDHGNCDQKLQGYADNMNASNCNFLNHRMHSSRPPVVELLGEFAFANSPRGRPVKSSNQYAGDAVVQEFSELVSKDVVKMQMDSSIVQSPSVRRERKEENSEKGENKDVMPAPVTPTPLRRSSRLRTKVTTP